MRKGPLADIRILAVSEYGAGPLTTQLFADLGADVVKIESTSQGDSSRYVPPYQSGHDSLFFQSLNRGSRSIAIDLKTPQGRAILAKLARNADAVFTNIRPRAADTLGLTYTALKAANPRIVAFLLTGWGRTGPDAGKPAYDYLVQAAGGQMDLNAEEGETPRRSSTPWIDTSTAFISAFGLLAAIHGARRSGVGCDVESSMIDTAMSQWMYLSTWYLSRGYQPERTKDSSHQSVVPSQVFKVADGHVMVTCMTHQFWVNLCDALQLPHLVGDARFIDFRSRRENRNELIVLLSEAFARYTRAEITAAVGGRVPMEAVRTFSEGMDEYRAKHPKSILSVDHPEFGAVQMVGAPLASDAWPVIAKRAPRWGEHTNDILNEAGLFDEEIRTMAEQGIVRCDPSNDDASSKGSSDVPPARPMSA
jgi:crotonobetainyl-CoA:carnitine CoA-transferase CaiB-like acyl-CoA transferase